MNALGAVLRGRRVVRTDATGDLTLVRLIGALLTVLAGL